MTDDRFEAQEDMIQYCAHLFMGGNKVLIKDENGRKYLLTGKVLPTNPPDVEYTFESDNGERLTFNLTVWEHIENAKKIALMKVNQDMVEAYTEKILKNKSEETSVDVPIKLDDMWNR